MKLILSVIAIASMCFSSIALAQAEKVLAGPQANCVAAIEKDNAAFAAALAGGIKSGKIDAKEKAGLEKTHAELTAAIKAAQADKNVSAAECKALGEKVAGQHKQYAAAMGAAQAQPGAAPAAGAKPAVPAVAPSTVVEPAKPLAAAPHPQANCIAAIEKDNAAFAAALAGGIKSGKIDAKEKAGLEKTHAELTAAIKAAQADKNVSAAECKTLGEKVAGQHKQYAAAMGAAQAQPGAAPAAPAKK